MALYLATVFGGSGFIGRHLVQRLAAQGWRVRVAVRDPVAARFLQPLGDVGQVVPVFADIRRDAAVKAAVEGASLVVNVVGILFERRRAGFQAIHVDGAARVAEAAAAAGAGSLVHVSALGADARSASAYARSKAAGEEAVLAAFPAASILRPSVVFGPEDDFFNRFARLASLSPVLPVFVTDDLRTLCRGDGCHPFGSGGARFQPVYAGDVADAIVSAASSPGHRGRLYQLGGPRVYSLKEVLELVLKITGRQRLLVPLPLSVARLSAAFLQQLPNPPLTVDQVRLLAVDNVVAPGSPGLAELGVKPTSAELILPSYLARYRASV
jgi:NADH dehydrogenase